MSVFCDAKIPNDSYELPALAMYEGVALLTPLIKSSASTTPTKLAGSLSGFRPWSAPKDKVVFPLIKSM